MKGRARTELIGLGLIALLALAFGAQSLRLTYPSYVFPRAAIVTVLVLCLINTLRVAGGAVTPEGIVARARQHFSPAVAIGGGATVLYVVFVNVLGFYTATFVFLSLLYNWFGGRELPPPMTVLLRVAGAAAATAIIYLVFAKALLVQTPRGFLL